MKKMVLMMMMMLASKSVLAGYIAPEVRCASTSGRTQVIYTEKQVNGVYGEYWILTIDGKSISFDADYFSEYFIAKDKILVVNYAKDDKYLLLHALPSTWKANTEKNGREVIKFTAEIQSYTTDPRTGKAVDKNIQVNCTRVQDPV